MKTIIIPAYLRISHKKPHAFPSGLTHGKKRHFTLSIKGWSLLTQLKLKTFSVPYLLSAVSEVSFFAKSASKLGAGELLAETPDTSKNKLQRDKNQIFFLVKTCILYKKHYKSDNLLFHIFIQNANDKYQNDLSKLRITYRKQDHRKRTSKKSQRFKDFWVYRTQ